jgi:hypothetical protein
MSAVLGVDPGVRGGIALLSDQGVVLKVQGFDPEMTEMYLVSCVGTVVNVLKSIGGRSCFFEKVGYIRGDGGQGAFTFGHIDGLLRGALIAYGATIHPVLPAMWQSSLGCLTGGDKNVTKRKAQALWPGLKITHAIADALLIAEYGRRRLFMP